MKKLFVLVGCISLLLFSCRKSHDQDPNTQQKPVVIKPSTKKMSFIITDIYSRLSTIRRQIAFFNKNTNVVLGRMFITLSCNDPNENLYRIIKYQPEKFSGKITLQSSHLIEFTKKILNGKLVKVEKRISKDVNAGAKPRILDSYFDPISDPLSDTGNTLDGIGCLFSIATCARTALDNMEWRDFADCLIEGNTCLGRIVGNCYGDVCK